MAFEATKLVLFILGLICILMSVTVSAFYLVLASILWGLLHALDWFVKDWPMDGHLGSMVPRDFYDQDDNW